MLKNKLLLSAILLSLFALCADAAAPAPRRGSAQPAAGGQQGVRGGTPATATNQQSGAQQSSGAAAPASARAGVRQTQAAPAAGASGGAKPVAARSGTTPAGAGGVKPAAGGGNVGGAGKPIAARSGTMNSVVQKGPSVQQAASSAGLVNEECKNKWNGCMDMFCILGNENGMRCSCSDQRKNLDSIMNDIDDLDNKIRQYGSSALEKVNLSDDQRAYIDAQMAKANADMSIDPNAPASQPGAATKKRPSLNQNAFANLSSEITFDAPQEEIIMDGEDLSKFSGDQLKVKAVDLCRKQMPAECRNDMQMLQTMYSQGIASDCKAFEVELNARKKKATENYQVVQAAVREAALDKYEEQNKWDLGQCVVEFGKCMKTEDTCGSEWQRCATDLYDQEELGGGAGKGNKTATKDVGGITLSGATMFRLESSKVICEGVLNSCVRVKDQVWDRFLTNVAPDLRSAEISSEANTRVSCLTDIAECVRDACMSKFDPKQQEADMNACLTDRNNARQFCALGKPGKLGINKCESALGQGLWGYLDAKLASMRIDACTESVKVAVYSDNVCGKKLENCSGMSGDAVLELIVRNGASDSRGQNDTVLVACREVPTMTDAQRADPSFQIDYSNVGATHAKIKVIIGGLLAQIQTGTAAICEEAIAKQMTLVCGSVTNCDGKFAANETIGKGSVSMDLNDCGKMSMNTEVKISGVSPTGVAPVSLSGGDGDFRTSIQNAVNLVLLQIRDYPEVNKCLSAMGASSKALTPFANAIFASAKEKAMKNISANAGQCVCCNAGSYLDANNTCKVLTLGTEANGWVNQTFYAPGGCFKKGGTLTGKIDCPSSANGWTNSSGSAHGTTSGCNDNVECCFMGGRTSTDPNKNNWTTMNYGWSMKNQDYTKVSWGITQDNGKGNTNSYCKKNFVLTYTGCCPKDQTEPAGEYQGCKCGIVHTGHDPENGKTKCAGI
jgi:hypothetical protein